MSTVNVSTIYAEYVNSTGNVFIGSSTVALYNNNTILVGSNVFINSTYIAVSDIASNTQINSTAISTSGITIGGKFVSSFPTSSYSDYQSFTANGTWTKPTWAAANDLVTIMMWGGGGGGDTSIGIGAGGGGACVIANKLAGDCNSVCNVVVGDAGLGTPGPATDGGNSVFWTNSTFSITAYGGGRGYGNGGGGGGWFGGAVFSAGTGGAPLGGNTSIRDSTFGGGLGANTTTGIAGSSVYGGGGGTGNNGAVGGSSIFGGGGGSASGAVGLSTFGGDGGNTTIAPTAPGGGGPPNQPGERGEVRVWVQKVT